MCKKMAAIWQFCVPALLISEPLSLCLSESLPRHLTIEHYKPHLLLGSNTFSAQVCSKISTSTHVLTRSRVCVIIDNCSSFPPDSKSPMEIYKLTSAPVRSYAASFDHSQPSFKQPVTIMVHISSRLRLDFPKSILRSRKSGCFAYNLITILCPPYKGFFKKMNQLLSENAIVAGWRCESISVKRYIPFEELSHHPFLVARQCEQHDIFLVLESSLWLRTCDGYGKLRFLRAVCNPNSHWVKLQAIWCFLYQFFKHAHPSTRYKVYVKPNAEIDKVQGSRPGVWWCLQCPLHGYIARLLGSDP